MLLGLHPGRKSVTFDFQEPFRVVIAEGVEARSTSQEHASEKAGA